MTIFIIFLSAILAVLLLNFFIPCFRLYLLDLPNLRSSHYSPTPRGGGLAFVLLSSLSCIPLLFEVPPRSITLIPLKAQLFKSKNGFLGYSTVELATPDCTFWFV